MIYRDPILAKVISIFNAEGPKALQNRFYFGDPVVVNKSYLPAVFVSYDNTETSNVTNAEDEERVKIVVNVVLDLTADFNQAFDKIGSASSLYDFMEGRNADYTMKSTSLKGIVRKHQNLDTKLWLNLHDPVTVNYGVGIQTRGQGIFSVESVMHLVVQHHQLRPT